jgi:Uma2 family endonuclease
LTSSELVAPTAESNYDLWVAVTSAHQRYTLEEYLQLEAYANVRHEFLAGQIFAMAGGTPEHGTYAANVIGILTSQLGERRCRVQSSDVRIRVRSSGLDTYPDASVVCGHAERDAGDPNAIVNPVVLVEVLSPGTAEYDSGEKLEHYKQIESLREVLLVAHGVRRIDVVRRQANGNWITLSAGSGESLELESIGCTLSVDAVYRDPLSE